MKDVKFCKNCENYIEHHIGECKRVKLDGATGEREHYVMVERCLPWVGAVIMRQCGKSGRYFKQKP